MTKEFVLATTIKTLRRSADATQHTAANLLTAQDKKIKELEAFKASVLDNLKQQAEDNKAAAALLDAYAKDIDKRSAAMAKKVQTMTKSLVKFSDELLGLQQCDKCGSTGPAGPCSWCAENP